MLYVNWIVQKRNSPQVNCLEPGRLCVMRRGVEDDRNGLSCRVLLEPLTYLKAGKVRQIDIQKNQTWNVGRRKRQRLRAGMRLENFKPALIEMSAE